MPTQEEFPQTDHPICYLADSKELILTHRRWAALPAHITATFGHCTEYLNLGHNRIINLTWIYEFPKLKYLILDNNRLHEALLQQLHLPLVNVKLLSLNKNELMDLPRTVRLLKNIFPNLEYLSLHGNPICPDELALQPFSEYVSYEYDYYKSFVVRHLNKLKFLDHSEVQNTFMGSILQSNIGMLKFTPKIIWASVKNSLLIEDYNPLPDSPQKYVGYHCGTISKLSKKECLGHEKDSVGNELIQNSDL